MFGVMPRKLKRERKKFALVVGIPFMLPVRSQRMQALMAAFPVDPAAAQALLPDRPMQVTQLWRRALLVVTVANYEETVIGCGSIQEGVCPAVKLPTELFRGPPR